MSCADARKLHVQSRSFSCRELTLSQPLDDPDSSFAPTQREGINLALGNLQAAFVVDIVLLSFHSVGCMR